MSVRRDFGGPERRSFIAQIPALLKSAFSAPPRRRRRAAVPTAIETMELRLYLSSTMGPDAARTEISDPETSRQDERADIFTAPEPLRGPELQIAPIAPGGLPTFTDAVAPPEITDPEPDRAQDEAGDASIPGTAPHAAATRSPFESERLVPETLPALADASLESVETAVSLAGPETLGPGEDENEELDEDGDLDEAGGWIDISSEAMPTGLPGAEVLVDPRPAGGSSFGFVDALASPESNQQVTSQPGQAADSGGFIELQFSEASPTWQRQLSSRDTFRQGRASEVDASIGRLVVFESADATGSRLGGRSSLSGMQSRLRSCVASAEIGDNAEEDGDGLFASLLASQKLNSLSSFLSRIFGAR